MCTSNVGSLCKQLINRLNRQLNLVDTEKYNGLKIIKRQTTLQTKDLAKRNTQKTRVSVRALRQG